MRGSLQCIASIALALYLLIGVVACDTQAVEDQRVLRVGVIASLSGVARPWGLATVRCAQVTAQYYNERGGFDLNGELVKIELVIVDDAFDAATTARAAHEMVSDGIKYIIGPLGCATVSAASRVLDSAGVFYVHYGFYQDFRNSSSLGVLGMPMPEQSLPVMFRHLRDKEEVGRVLVLAYGTESGIRQKGVAEQVAIDEGLDLVRLARYDISEGTFDPALNYWSTQRKVAQVVAAAPDALMLVACPPEAFLVLVDRLREGGYDGVICTQNFQDPNILSKLGAASDEVYFVGGEPSDRLRTEYFEDLKARYLDLADQWSEEANTKLYALELIMACIRAAGVDALEETTVMYRVLPNFSFQDPFYQQSRMVSLVGGQGDVVARQLESQIRISKMSGSQAILVEEATSVLP